MRREEAADQRTGHAREPEHGAEDALVAAAVAGRHDVADRRLRRHHQAATTEPLNSAEGDQLRHVLREAAEDRADQEDHEADLEHDLASVLVAELPVERRHDRLGQQVGGHDPREVIEAAEVADDRRQGRRDDRAVERGEQHHQHEAREDDVEVRRACPVGRVGLRSPCRRWLRHPGQLVHRASLVRTASRQGYGVTVSSAICTPRCSSSASNRPGSVATKLMRPTPPAATSVARLYPWR